MVHVQPGPALAGQGQGILVRQLGGCAQGGWGGRVGGRRVRGRCRCPRRRGRRIGRRRRRGGRIGGAALARASQAERELLAGTDRAHCGWVAGVGAAAGGREKKGTLGTRRLPACPLGGAVARSHSAALGRRHPLPSPMPPPALAAPARAASHAGTSPGRSRPRACWPAAPAGPAHRQGVATVVAAAWARRSLPARLPPPAARRPGGGSGWEDDEGEDYEDGAEFDGDGYFGRVRW